MPRKTRTSESSSSSSRPRATRGRRGRGLPIYGIVLVVVGLVLLLQTTGILPWDLWLNLWRFWPLLVIALGVHLLLGRRIGWIATAVATGAILVAIGGTVFLGSGREKPVSSVAEGLNGIETADVSITFGAGNLNVRSLPASSANLIEGRFGNPGQGARVQLLRSGSAGRLNITMDRRPWIRWFSKTSWDIALSQTIATSLKLEGGASSVSLDLRELGVRNLNVDVGASSAQITMPANAGDVMADINAGAADLTITVPQDVAAKIKKNSGVSSFVIDGGRFPQVGNLYVSPDFETAKNRVTLDLDVGASSVIIR